MALFQLSSHQPAKTKLMLFGVRQNLAQPQGPSSTSKDRSSKFCKDLSIILDPSLSFNDYIGDLTSSLLLSMSNIKSEASFFYEHPLSN